MGKYGTDVAKEIANIVLTDDNFSTIKGAISEGKGMFSNIRNFLAFQFSTSFTALAMQSVATLFLLLTPLNAMQLDDFRVSGKSGHTFGIYTFYFLSFSHSNK